MLPKDSRNVNDMIEPITVRSPAVRGFLSILLSSVPSSMVVNTSTIEHSISIILMKRHANQGLLRGSNVLNRAVGLLTPIYVRVGYELTTLQKFLLEGSCNYSSGQVINDSRRA